MGQDYRPVKYYATDSRSWIHNGYLAVVLNFGLIGAGLYFGMYAVMTLGMLKAFRQETLGMETRIVLLTGALVMIENSLVGMVGPVFVREYAVPVFGLFWGCLLCARKREMSSPPQPPEPVPAQGSA
jgi:O-antigen ligase